MGFLLRNHQGKFLMAKAESAHGPMDAMTAESLSCRAALLWIRQGICGDRLSTTRIGYKQPYILLFFTRIDYSGLYRPGVVWAIPEYSINFVRQSATYATHLLSRSAGSESVHGKWVGNPLESIMDVIFSQLI